ncbi:MAG: right-handed parallel beta-helix repeat-containing protein [Wenzhouxiangella sp.]|jgi:hypothetical protein|nr:right-handed parallel beta-helix repeat-containing protein [Wenzhouxiangella sp.]
MNHCLIQPFWRARSVALILAFVALAQAEVWAVTLNVTSTDDNGAGTLRQAILDANNSGASEVRIEIDLPDNSEIRINTGDLPFITHPAVEIINGNPNRRVAVDGSAFFRLFLQIGSDSTLSVSGLELRDARMESDGPSDGGACLYTQGDASISNARFINCQAINASGGAVHVLGNLIVEDSQFIDNRVFHSGSDFGGAVYCAGDSCRISGSIFEGNEVSRQLASQFNRGGGAAALLADEIVIENSVFRNNVGPGRGGALRLVSNQADTSISIRRSLFRQNEGNEGGAVWLEGGSTLNVEFSTFDRNVASARAPALSTSLTAEVNLIGNVFYMQESENASVAWGTVFVFGNSAVASTVRLDYNTFVGEDENSILFEANEGSSPSDVVVAQLHANIFDQRASTPACREESAPVEPLTGWFNVVSDDSCTASIEASSQINVDPKLHPAIQRSDSTIVYPRADSVAVDLVTSQALAPCIGVIDLGGTVRPLDGNGTGFAFCDAGALERNVELFSDRFER